MTMQGKQMPEQDRLYGWAGCLQAYLDICQTIYDSPMGRDEAAKGGDKGDVVTRVIARLQTMKRPGGQQESYGL